MDPVSIWTHWERLFSPAVLGWISLLSALTFVVSLMVVPLIAVRIPPDYFDSKRRHRSALRRLHPALFMVAFTLKNALAVILVAGGIIMLVLPGQGILTILIGIAVSNFPGKYRLERRLVSLPGVLAAINWIRGKARVEPLRKPAD